MFRILRLGSRRVLRTQGFSSQYPAPDIVLPRISLNLDFYLDPDNTADIRDNIRRRNSDADIDKVIALAAGQSAKEELVQALTRVPNMSHPKVKDLSEPRVVYQRDFVAPAHKVRSFEEISRILGGLRTQNLVHFSGERTYYLTGPLAELEHALINWTVDVLTDKVDRNQSINHPHN